MVYIGVPLVWETTIYPKAPKRRCGPGKMIKCYSNELCDPAEDGELDAQGHHLSSGVSSFWGFRLQGLRSLGLEGFRA